MELIVREITLGFRRLTRVPGLALAVILVLGLGIGATTTIFSAVDGVLLADLPFGHSERLVMVKKVSSSGKEFAAFAPAELLDLRREVSALEEVTGVRQLAVTLTGEGEPTRLAGASVSGNFFDTLGVRPQLGSGFEREPGGVTDLRQAVLSHGLWQSRFGGAGDVLGREIRLDGDTYRVAAVLPQGFEFPEGIQLWLPGEKDIPRLPHPFPQDLESIREMSYFSILGRVGPGISPAEVAGQLARLTARLQEEFPQEYENASWSAAPLKEHLVGKVRRQLWVLLGAVLLVLLVACANAANLLTARAVAQRRDRVIRQALGAGRARLLGFSLVESLLLGLGGGLFGLGLAAGGIRLLKALGPEEVPRLAELTLDARVLLFGVAAALGAGLLSGLLPTLESGRSNLVEGLKEGASANLGSGRRLRSTLVVLEVALALVLLIGAGLMLRSLYELRRTDPGFRVGEVWTVGLEVPQSRYGDPRGREQFYRDLLRGLEHDPAIQRAAVAVGVPFSGARIGLSFEKEGQLDPEREQVATFVAVSPGYFETLGMRLEAGRTLQESDLDSPQKSALVSRAMVDAHWPDQDPLGQKLSLGEEDDGTKAWLTIVGVVADVHQGQLDADPEPTIYGPFTEFPFPFMTLVVRSSASGEGVRKAIAAQVFALDPQVPVETLRPMAQSISRTLAERRFLAILLAAFAAVSLLLAGIGLYGLMAYSVAQRSREIGIRMALGARRQGVVALIVGQGMALTLLGLAVGVALALATTRVLATFLYQVQPWDPPTFGGLTIFLAAIAFLATYLPARRASRVDPNRALRSE